LKKISKPNDTAAALNNHAVQNHTATLRVKDSFEDDPKADKNVGIFYTPNRETKKRDLIL
jgi:hypothetical protein